MVCCPATFSTQVRTPSRPGWYWRARCHTSMNTAFVTLSASSPGPNRQAAESRTCGDSTSYRAWNAILSPATVRRTYSSSRSASDMVAPGGPWWASAAATRWRPWQYQQTTRISAADLRVGDLIFFYSDRHHVAIYVGGGWTVHAPHPGDRVRMAKISEMGPVNGYGRVR